MSAVPLPYTRQASFTLFQTEAAPTVGLNLEAELNNIATAMSATQSRLSEIQRDDGGLGNQSVHPDALSTEVRALLTTQAGTIRGAWVGATNYAIKDVVSVSGAWYLAVSAHTSAVAFATDLAAGKWMALANPNVLPTVLRYGAVGNGATDDRAAFSNANAAGTLVYIPGTSTGYAFSSPLSTTAGSWLPDPGLTWANLTNSGKLGLLRGHFTGAGSGANIWRLADRVFIGDAASGWSGAAAGVPDAGNSWFAASNTSGGPAFLGVHASLLVTSPETGGSTARYGIVGAAKLSALTTTATGAIGVAGAVVANKAGTAAAWAFYGDVTAIQGTAHYGMEIAVKNATGVNVTSHVYAGNPAGGVGLQLSGGGDNSYGPASTNPSTCGIVFVRNSQSWNKGICFNSTSMSLDGGGIATCIEMPTNYSVTWLTNDGSGLPAARIYSTVTANGNRSIQVFENDSVSFYNNAGARTFQAGGTAASVNYLKLTGAVAASAPSLAFTGADTDITGIYTTKGAGSHNFYTNASSALQVVIAAVAGANDYIQFQGAINGATVPTISAQGSTNVPLTLQTKGAANLLLDPQTGDIKWGKAVVAPGGGAAATNCTIGGSGPTTAAAQGWIRAKNSAGAVVWWQYWI